MKKLFLSIVVFFTLVWFVACDPISQDSSDMDNVTGIYKDTLTIVAMGYYERYVDTFQNMPNHGFNTYKYPDFEITVEKSDLSDQVRIYTTDSITKLIYRKFYPRYNPLFGVVDSGNGRYDLLPTESNDSVSRLTAFVENEKLNLSFMVHLPVIDTENDSAILVMKFNFNGSKSH